MTEDKRNSKRVSFSGPDADDASCDDQRNLRTPLFAKMRGRRDDGTSPKSSPRRDVTDMLSALNGLTSDDGLPPDVEYENGELTREQQTTFHKVIANFEAQIAKTAGIANESYRRAIAIASDLARETELRKGSDTTLRSTVERLESELNQETKARQAMMRNLEEARREINILAAALEKLVAKRVGSCHENNVPDCYMPQARAEEIAAECHGELTDIVHTMYSEFRAEVHEEATCELSAVVGTAEAKLYAFITEHSSCCAPNLQ